MSLCLFEFKEHGTDYAVESGPEIEDDNIAAENSGKNGALSIPLAAIGFMTRLASGIFSRGRKHSDPSNLEMKNEDDLQPDGLTLNRESNDGSTSQKLYEIEDQLAKLTTNCNGEVEHIADADSDLLEIAETLCNLQSPEAGAPREESSSTFRGFDIVRDPVDHHFLGEHGQVSTVSHTKELCMLLIQNGTSLTTLLVIIKLHILFHYFSVKSNNGSSFKFTEQCCQEVAQESSKRLGYPSE